MDVENANCKLRVSQCTNMEIMPVERPIKIDREITGLDMLLGELHSMFSSDYVNVHDVQKLLSAYKSEPKDWKKYAKFDRFRYTRNLVDSGNGAFNVMVLCWGAGHASAVHDHADAHCFMKVLRGRLEEVRYDWPDHIQPEVYRTLKNKPRSRCYAETEECDKITEIDLKDLNDSCQNLRARNDSEGQDGDDGYELQSLREIDRSKLNLDDVCYINDALGLHRVENPSHAEGAVSLHVYCPPFDSCRVFDTRTGASTAVTVTYASVYGRRMRAVTTANDVADSQQ